jgi:hypothetical protein
MENKLGNEIDTSEWELEISKDLPHQRNGEIYFLVQ